MGLTSLEQITASLPVSSAPTLQIIQKNAIDIQEHKQFVNNAWSHYYRADFVAFFQDTLSRMNTLYKLLPYVQGKEADHLKVLLSEFHVTLSYIHRDLQQYDEAINQAHLAVLLVKESAHTMRYASALYARGLAHFVYADFSPAILQETDSFRKKHLTIALNDFQAAYALAPTLDLHQRGHIHLKLGQVQARLAQEYSTKKEAMNLIEGVGTMARRSAGEEDLLFYKLNEDQFHLEQSAAFIALGWSSQASDSLSLVHSTVDTRRNAYCDLLWAQIYLLQNNYPAALGAAQASLSAFSELNSYVSVGRIGHVHQALKKSSYGNNPEVARLGYLLDSTRQTKSKGKKKI